MKHTLKHFLECSSIKDKKLVNLIDNFNKIGIEVENFFFTKKSCSLELKIPADRLDLKTSFYFFEDNIFYLKLEKKNKWQSIKSHYLEILKYRNKKDNFLKSFLNFPLNSRFFAKTKEEYLKESYFIPTYIESKEKYIISFHNFLNLYRKKFTERYIKIVLNNEKLINKILCIRKKKLEQILSQQNFNLSTFVNFPFRIIAEDKFKLFFLIPFYRKDLNREIDLIEEYCKCLGYEKFQSYYPKLEFIKKDQKSYITNLLKIFLLHENYNEVFTNSLNKYKDKNIISLLNPLNNELENLQGTLLGNHINLLYKNKERLNNQSKLFEIAHLFKKNKGKIEEISCLQCSFLQKIENDDLLNIWLEKKSDFDRLFDYFQLTDIKSFIQIKNENKKFEEKSIFYKIDKKIVAQLRLFKNEIEEKYYVFSFQLNLTILFRELKLPKTKKINYISKYPSIEKDLSFFTLKIIDFYKLKKEILAKYKNVKKLSFFDIYINKKINKIGIRLIFQSYDQTLTNLQIDKEIEQIIFYLKKNYQLIPNN